jgi:tetratricopeptide (TPR) repeat protein
MKKTARRGKAVAKAQARSRSSALPDRNWLWGLLLVLATIVVYQQAWHAGFIWDDDLYVTENKLLTAPDGLQRIWFSLDSPSQYFPLVYTTFRLEYALWGLNPVGYHWVNILLHAANAVLVWRLLRRLDLPGAWLAAALFALHPVHVESVAWITERKNVLMGLFFLLSLLAWTRFLEERPGRMWKYYGLALFFYALALFSKTTACTLPAALLLIWWLKKNPINARRLAQTVPFIVLGVAMGLVSLWWERHHQGTQGELFAMALPERILLANRALWFYAGKLLWPINLTFSYPRWTISAGNPLDYLWLVATVAFGAAVYFVRRRAGRSVEVAALFFAATLSPMLGFIMLYTFRYSFVADHYQYLASIGPLALVAAGLTTAFDSLEKRASFLRPAFWGVLLLALGILTWRQGAIYADSDTLWRATIATNPRSWMAHIIIAMRLQDSGRPGEAIPYYNTALEINPDYGEGHYNLANALVKTGRVDEAIAHYKKAVEINPKDAAALYNLATATVQAGRAEEAVSYYQRALEINPANAAALHNLGNTLVQLGRLDEAINHYRKAVEIQPGHGTAHYNLGNALLRLGDAEQALLHFRKAVEIDPQNAQAHAILGHTLLQTGRLEEGSAHVEKARTIDSKRLRKDG